MFSWLVLSMFQFITNMINVNMTSVCQVSLSVLTNSAHSCSSERKYSKYLQPNAKYLYITPNVCLKLIHGVPLPPPHFPPFVLLLLSPLLVFLPWYLQCLSCSQSNGGLHQRCLYLPPTFSLSVSVIFFFYINSFTESCSWVLSLTLTDLVVVVSFFF